MIKATTGTWLNYSTTLLFQILFARAFGTSDGAAAFQLTFLVATACSGVFTTTLLTIVVPRVDMGARHPIGSSVARSLALLATLVAVLSIVALVGAPALADLLAKTYQLSPQELTRIIRLSACLLLLQSVAGFGITCAVVEGARFRPALAPGGPTIVAVLGMLLIPDASVSLVYAFLILGTLLEFVLLASSARRLVWPKEHRGIRAHHVVEPITGVVLATLSLSAMLSSLGPLELLLASAIAGPQASAEYAYAARSLAVAQQLIIGGLSLAALGDWSRAQRGAAHAEQLSAPLNRSLGLIAVVVAGAVATAVLLGSQLIALIYQRGEFSAADTAAVYRLLLLAVGGFALDSVSNIVSQALVAMHRNDIAVRNGGLRWILRVVLMAVFGLSAGVDGIALAWTVTSVFGLVINMRSLGITPIVLSPALRTRVLPLTMSLIVASVCIAVVVNVDAVTVRVGAEIIVLAIVMRFVLNDSRSSSAVWSRRAA